MRNVGWLVLTSSFIVAGGGLCASACLTVESECALAHTCVDAGGPLPPACEGDPTTDASLLRDDCGVYVQANATGMTEDGTRTNPYKTLQKAVDNAGNKWVYACAGEMFVESVMISTGTAVYGGFDCANGWTWSDSARAQLHGVADSVALTIAAGADGAKIEGFAITAASPKDMKGGGSSIAVAVGDVTATLDRCDLSASAAADGQDGQTPTDPVMNGAMALAADPMTANACVLPAVVAGGAPAMAACDDGTASGGVGGKGGVSGSSNGDGSDGGDGTPAGSPDHGKGATIVTDCSDGMKGQSGTDGPAGPGGSAKGDSLSLAGILNKDKTGGQLGIKGQGGGGGGGARPGLFCGSFTSPADGPGASGGGGGAGGCGGKGGGGGRAGGDSIAVISVGTKLTLSEVTLAVGNAGKGGNGALGQPGGDGGGGGIGGAKSGIVPSKSGCKGGDGGVGGAGGPGGGGRGGHAVGVAYANGPAASAMVKTFTPGMVGMGGTAATGAPMTSNGSPGNAGPCWDLAKNAACM